MNSKIKKKLFNPLKISDQYGVKKSWYGDPEDNLNWGALNEGLVYTVSL